MRTWRRFLVPEVVQTSGMDCGPASLKCLLEGFGIRASYGRLREACQTDVDGTSIDTIEEVARQLGLDAEQIMVPADHVLMPEAGVLPAIVVVRLPNGVTHFLVAWRRIGGLVQLMDPAVGRRWVTAARFLEEIYAHRQAVPAADWREWAASDAFLKPLRRRLAKLGIRGKEPIRDAARDPGWRALAALDAAARAVAAMVASGGVRRGRQAARVLERLRSRPELIPANYWSVWGGPAARQAGQGPAAAQGAAPPEDELMLRGAVLVQVRGKLPAESRAAEPESPELAAALRQPASRPGRDLLGLLRADGILAPAALLAAMLLAAAGVTVEAVLFRGLIDLGRELGLSGQRLGASAALLVFLAGLLLLELPLAASLLRYGRRLEARLRLSFLEKIPHLADRYFESRLKSDMAERSHAIHRIRHLPGLGGHLLRNTFELLFTAAGIAWLDPPSAPLAFATAGVVVALPLLAQPAIVERDLRVRSHTGALSRFYLDALLGLVPIRTHGAERVVRREHGSLLTEWARAALGLQRIVVRVEAAQFTLGFGLAAALLLNHLARGADAGAVLLLAFWALNLPVLGQEIALVAWEYPAYRNRTLRLLEPLGAPEAEPRPLGPLGAPQTEPRPSGSGFQGRAPAVSLAFHNVSVRACGHTILENIDAEIPAGGHVAIVGPSGAGKSSLVGLLLGWHRAAAGEVLADGVPVGDRIDELRRATAWVDPAVQLWNRSLLGNLCYGTHNGGSPPIAEVIEEAELRQVLQRLPEGLETSLGEGGALVSGGEGQRVRLGRAMFRSGTRLVILDEPFRGLDRGQRREMLARARRLWRKATLLAITHDVGETLAFDRVLVIEGGRIVEDGAPVELAARDGSRYRAMLEAEGAVRETLWSDRCWRRLRLDDGRLREGA